MEARFNISGTHINSRGLLCVRFDIYPDATAKTYSMQHVIIYRPTEKYPGELIPPGRPADIDDYKSWLTSQHMEEVTNPMLCYFVTVPETLIKSQLINYLRSDIFNPNNLAKLDNILVLPDSLHRIDGFFKNKKKFSIKPVQTGDIEDLIGSINAMLDGMKINLPFSPTNDSISPGSIDIGPGAINQPDTTTGGTAFVDEKNPADGDGNITSGEVWANSNLTNFHFSTSERIAGANFTCRDNENVGGVTSGSKQTYNGLTIAVATGDYEGAWWDGGGGSIEYDWAGGGGGVGLYWDADAGNTILQPTVNHTYTGHSSPDTISIYGTGVESGGSIGRGPSMASKMISGRLI